MDEYEGAWITTYTGKQFHFLKPTPDEVDIRDIAHHLSLLCRFTGACRWFYSVADHSIRVAELVPQELKLSALLHDAAEAYINDISRPVKYSHKLDDTEVIIMSVIVDKFGINPTTPEIREADNILIATEARDLMTNMDCWAPLPNPLGTRVRPLDSKPAEIKFLFKFRLYGGKE